MCPLQHLYNVAHADRISVISCTEDKMVEPHRNIHQKPVFQINVRYVMKVWVALGQDDAYRQQDTSLRSVSLK